MTFENTIRADFDALDVLIQRWLDESSFVGDLQIELLDSIARMSDSDVIDLHQRQEPGNGTQAVAAAMAGREIAKRIRNRSWTLGSR